MISNWGQYAPFFKKEEFDCKETGENRMTEEFMSVLYNIRVQFNKPIIITSGYRSPNHSIEIAKSRKGEHTYGVCADCHVDRSDMLQLSSIAYQSGVRRIGFNFKSEFLHIGIGDRELEFPPVPWGYT